MSNAAIFSRDATTPGLPSGGSAANVTAFCWRRSPARPETSAFSAVSSLAGAAGSGVIVLTSTRVALPSKIRFDAASSVAGVNMPFALASCRILYDVSGPATVSRMSSAPTMSSAWRAPASTRAVSTWVRMIVSKSAYSRSTSAWLGALVCASAITARTSFSAASQSVPIGTMLTLVRFADRDTSSIDTPAWR